MAIRMTGLNSGLDTDSIVQALMSAQRMKKTKVESKKTKLEWKKDIWSELNTTLYDFYKGSLAKIKSQGSFKSKTTTSSDNSKVTASATSAAAEGTYSVKVNSVASAQYVTSGKLNTLDDGSKATTKTKLTDLRDSSGNAAFTAGTQISVKGKDGTSTLLIDGDTTIDDFVTTCKNAGLTASFDEGQQRFFINSATSGADQAFSITASVLDSSQMASVNNLRDAVGYEYLSATDKKAVSKIFDQIQSGAKTVDDVSESLKSYAAKAAQTGVKKYYTDQLTTDYNNRFFTDDDHTTVSEEGKQALIDAGATQEELDGLSAEELAKKAQNLVSTKVNEDIASENYQNLISDGITNGIAGAVDSDGNADRFLQHSQVLRDMDATIEAANYKASMSNLTADSTALRGLGLGTVDGTAVAEGDSGNTTGMVVVGASDATVQVNGATLTSSTSTLTVNGLTLNILAETQGQDITISVSKDTSGIYDNIKDFISEYNSVLKKMNTYYNAASAKDYDVLTDDQKEAMTDDQVEKWENKIKDSLLRRDDTLSSLISSFRNNLMGSYTASDGKKYSLSTLGISTSADYAEGGLLHIKGDEDDSEYAEETNKLEEMLNKDPDLVMEVINGITGNLYNDLMKKMSKTTMSSALTFYNDKEMSSQLSDYKKEISNWETKLSTIEERYYSQFTAMEKAMASLTSQQNSLSSFFS